VKISELLVERRSADLYHWMDAKKADAVFKDDAFTQLWSHETKEGTFHGTSLSRNANFTYGEKPVRLTFDQAKLANRFKIIPLDAERAFHYSMHSASWFNMKDRKINKDGQQYAEEFVIGKIKNLHEYLTHVEISKHVRRNAVELVEAARAYCDKWNLKLTIAP